MQILPEHLEQTCESLRMLSDRMNFAGLLKLFTIIMFSLSVFSSSSCCAFDREVFTLTSAWLIDNVEVDAEEWWLTVALDLCCAQTVSLLGVVTLE